MNTPAGFLTVFRSCWVACLILAAYPQCGWTKDKLVVASKAFPESRLLAEIMAQLIEDRMGMAVDRKMGLSGTLICFQALKQGEVDLYPEYTGTGLIEILHEPLGHDPSSETTYQRVRAGFAERFHIRWLAPFGFENGYALAVHRDSPFERVSDLAQAETSLRARFHHAFILREDGFPGVAERYGLHIEDVRGMEHGLAYIALCKRQIDLMEAYTTDAVLKKYPLRLLEDDLAYFPPYDAAPIVRQDALDRYPLLEGTLESLAGKLSQDRMVELNYQVAVQGRPIATVARNFLATEGLVAVSVDNSSAWGDALSELLLLIVQHLSLSLTATGLASCVGILLGVFVAQHPKALAAPILGTTSVLQTIPGLALLAFMIPLLGIGWLPVISALFLYALLPIVRNTYTGIASVPKELKEAGRAMGMTDRQLLRQLELPLAIKTIMAGVRTALVINIGTATLGAFIGAGGLGEPIVRGLQQGDTSQILWGAVPAALLALACDFLMSLAEKRLQPRGLRLEQA